MRRYLSILSILYLPLSAEMQLQQQYTFETGPIYSTTLFPDTKEKFILFNINNRTRFRIRSSEIVQRFKEHNLSIESGAVRYVNFIKKSPIQTTSLEQLIVERYYRFYNNLHVNHVQVTPRSYLKEMPSEYQLLFSDKNLYHAEGIFSIKTPEKKRLFFNYRIDATLDVYMPRRPLKRKEALTPLNTVKKQIQFERLRALPLEQVNTKAYRLKRSMKPGQIITRRDIELYPIVKRGSSVVVEFKSGSVILQFSAIASQDGAKNDIITIQKKDGRRIKARVIAAGRVEIE